MKTPYKVHLAIGQYEFVEVDAISADNAKELNDEVKIAFQEAENGSGLNVKDWQRVLDTYLLENRISEADYTGMSDRQKLLINEIKKSLARIKSKTDVGTRAEDPYRIIN